jgi:putative membrane protein
MAVFFVAIAALIHLYIFVLESLLWGKPKTNRAFGMQPDMAEANRLFAFNQGFYNLFLAVAAISGLVMGLDTIAGSTLAAYSLLSMMLAAVVLIFSNPKLLRPALIQGLPPLLGLAFLALRMNT